MVESILVYGLLMVVMIICGKIAAGRQRHRLDKGLKFTSFLTPEIIVILLSFSCVFGARYDVGIDHLSYLRIFNDIGRGDGFRQDLEPGFVLLTGLFSRNGIHFFFYFATFSLLQIFFVYYAFKNERYLYPYLAFFIMSGVFLGWMNGMRQYTVVCIFMWMVHFASDKKFVAYCLCLIICSYFLHTSAVLLFPVYFLLRIKRDFFSSIPVQLAGLAVVLLLNLNAAVFTFFTDVNNVMNLIGYEDRFKNFDAEETSKAFSYGARTLITISIYILAILYSKRLKRAYAGTNFRLFYTLFYLGVCFHTLFNGNHILQRPSAYFIGMSLPVYAYFLHYLWRQSTIHIHRVVLLYIISITLIHFLLTVYLGQAKDCTQFSFFWQAPFALQL